MWCPTPDCGYGFIYDTIIDQEFTCEVCENHYCIKCMGPFHEGSKCQLNEDAKDTMKKLKFQKCPSCKAYVGEPEDFSSC